MISIINFIFSLILITSEVKGLQLTLIHTNDVHSRFLQVNAKGNPCSEVEEAHSECYGGFARLYHKAEEIRRNYPNVIYLSGGDYFQGTVWYTLYKWEVVSHFVQKLNHTAMALGNHEFDDGVNGLIPFLDRMPFPVLSANIDASKEPSIDGKFKKSTIIEYEGVKVGIIGYTTEETMLISNPGKNLIFENVTSSVAAEAKRLNEEGITIIIAVGHAGYEVDLEVGKIPFIDAVVGGHTNTFLYNGTAPSDEIPEDKYPTVVTKEDGKRTPVVQAFAFGKYLGFLNLTFDDSGEILSWSGNPILLNMSIPQDESIFRELKEWEVKVNERIKTKVGTTKVFLDGDRMTCRKGECNLGNVIADGQVSHYLKFAASKDHWTDTTLSIVHSGSIRLSVNEKAKNGTISMEDILSIQPFGHSVDIMTIKGKHLREVFEFSVSGFDPNYFDPSGKFLQVAGFKIVYDITKPNGNRVKSIQVLCSKCRIPHYEPLIDEQIYKVVVPGFLVNAGSGYDVIKKYVIEHHTTGVMDTEVLTEYLSTRSPVTVGIEGRIRFETYSDRKNNCKEFIPTTTTTTVPPPPILLNRGQTVEEIQTTTETEIPSSSTATIDT